MPHNPQHRDSNGPEGRLAVPDWTTLNEDQPFYNSVEDKYCIPVATDIDYIDANIVIQARPLVLEKGLENLFLFYNKEIPTPGPRRSEDDERTDIQVFLDSLVGLGQIEASKYHLDSRPCSALRFLVCVDAPRWDSVPNKLPKYVSPVASGPITTVVTYKVSEIGPLIDSVASSLESMASQTGALPPGVDLYQEAQRIRAIYPSLLKMLFLNNVTPGPQSKELIQFSFSGEPRVLLVNAGIKRITTSDQRTLASKIEIGFKSFVETPPIEYAKTRKYLSTLRELQKAFECSDTQGTGLLEGWISRETYDGITDFTHDAAYVWDRFSNSPRGRQAIEDIKEGWPFEDFINKKAKTASDVREEKKALSPARKLLIEEGVSEKWSYVGDLLLSAGAQKELISSINSSNDAFKKLMDRVWSWDYLQAVALRTAAQSVTNEEFNAALFRTAMRIVDRDELWGIARTCVPIDILIASGVTTDLEIINPRVSGSAPPTTKEIADGTPTCDQEWKLSNAGDKLIDILENGHPLFPQYEANPECVEEAIEKICPVPARMFGWHGQVENFLERNTSNFLAWDRENLCPDPGDEEKSPWNFPHFEIPSIGPFDIFDVSAGVIDIFMKLLRETTDRLIVGIVKEILGTLLENLENILCNWSDLKSFGKERMSSIWEDVAGTPERHFLSALSDWGLDPEWILGPDPGGLDPYPGVSTNTRIINFMNDVSDCLNPGELRAALQGEVLGQNQEVIKRASKAAFPKLDPSITMDILAYAARDVDFRTLDQRSRQQTGQYICDNINADEYEKNFRKSYALRASPEEVDKLWVSEKEKSLKKITDLAEMVSTSTAELLQKGATCAIPQMPPDPANQHMAMITINAAYSPTETSFNADLKGWPSMLLSNTPRPAGKDDYQYEMLWRQIYNTEEIEGVGPPSPDAAFDNNRADIARAMAQSRITVGAAPGGGYVSQTEVLPGIQRAMENNNNDVLTITRTPDGVDVNLNFSIIGVAEDTQGQLTETSGILPNIHYHTRTTALAPIDINGVPSFPVTPRDNFYLDRYTLSVPTSVDASGRPTAAITYDSDTVNPPPGLDAELIRYIQTKYPNFLTDDANPRELTAQQIMFANYLTNGRMPDGIDSEAFNYYAVSGYLNCARVVLDQVADYFADSPLFSPTGEGRPGLMDIRLDRGAPPDLPCPPGMKPQDNIIRLNYEKKKVTEAYETAKQKEQETGERRALQDAMVPSILRGVVRVHIAEIALRSIFGLSRFTGDKHIFKDGALQQVTIDFIKAKLTAFISNNNQAFGLLGTNADPIVNFENQIKAAGFDSLGDAIVSESQGVFDEINIVMDEEFPQSQRWLILLALGRKIPLVPTPEATFMQTGSSFPNLPNTHVNFYEDSPQDWEPDSPGRPVPDSQKIFKPLGDKLGSMSLNPEFRVLEKGYFVFEKFIEFEPLSGDNVIHNDVFQGYLENRLSNPNQSLRQVENIEAFRTYFRSGVLTYAALEEEFGINDPADYEGPLADREVQWPILHHPRTDAPMFVVSPQGSPTLQPIALETRFWNKQDSFRGVDYDPDEIIFMADRYRRAREDYRNGVNPFERPPDSADYYERAGGAAGTPLGYFANRKLADYFESLKYGVRLVYVSTDPDAPLGESYTIGNQHMSTISVAEETQEIPIEEYTIASFYGTFSGRPAAQPWYRYHGYDSLWDAEIFGSTKREKAFRYFERTGIQTADLYRAKAGPFISSGDDPFAEDFRNWQRGLPYRPVLQSIFESTPSPGPLSFEALRERLINKEDFKVLFDFALGGTRLTSLLAIYCMQSAEFTNPSLNNAFNKTKGSLISTLYAMQPVLPATSFYKYQDPNLAAAGGPTGLLKAEGDYASTSGPNGDAAAQTVPFIVKGLAQFQDPSYAFASKLDMFGALPPGLGAAAIPLVAPINLGGPGPPVTSMGLAAYGFGTLPGERVSFEDRAKGAQGKLSQAEDQCVEDDGVPLDNLTEEGE